MKNLSTFVFLFTFISDEAGSKQTAKSEKKIIKQLVVGYFFTLMSSSFGGLIFNSLLYQGIDVKSEYLHSAGKRKAEETTAKLSHSAGLFTLGLK